MVTMLQRFLVMLRTGGLPPNAQDVWLEQRFAAFIAEVTAQAAQSRMAPPDPVPAP